MNEQLSNYIQQQIALGIPKETIIQNLKAGGGWSEEEVREIFNELEKKSKVVLEGNVTFFKKRTFVRILVIVHIVLILLAFLERTQIARFFSSTQLVPTVYASSPGFGCSMNPWFNLSYTTDYSNLPKTVSVTQESTTNQSSYPLPGYYILANNTDIPLYLIALDSTGSSFPEIPQGYAPKGRIDNRGWYYYSNNQWTPQYNNYPEHVYYLTVNHNFNIPMEMTDNRPKDVSIPEPLSFEHLFLYNGEILTVPVKVSYILREDYNPHQIKECQSGSFGGSGSFFDKSIFFFLLILSTINLTFFSLLYYIKKSISQNQFARSVLLILFTLVIMWLFF